MAALSASAPSSVQPQFKGTAFHKVLWANVAVSVATGLLLLLDSVPVADWMGIDQPTLLVGLGVVCLLFAAFVWDTARRKTLDQRRAWAIIELDFFWVVASAVLLISNVLTLTTGGNWAVLIAGDIVLALAAAEFVTFRRYAKSQVK